MSKAGQQFTIAWALQGGGARGSFQVGAYRAATEAGYHGTVFSGISIGAINSAILAGNKPEERIAKLRSFWRTISRRSVSYPFPTWMNYATHHWAGWMTAFMSGQPGFFEPRFTNPFFATPGTPEATSFYDTSKLRQTLVDHIDFDLINCKNSPVRLLLGAVEVRTGKMVWFDSKKTKITAEHVMASGALPPGFPGIRIDGKLYWDGGCHTNTAIDIILQTIRGQPLHIFMPILFSTEGDEPRTLEEVERRLKDIQYGSHSTYIVERMREAIELRRKLNHALNHLPNDPAVRKALAPLFEDARQHQRLITTVEYVSPPYETARNDADFDEVSLLRREEAGYDAMKAKLAALAECNKRGEELITF